MLVFMVFRLGVLVLHEVFQPHRHLPWPRKIRRIVLDPRRCSVGGGTEVPT